VADAARAGPSDALHPACGLDRAKCNWRGGRDAMLLNRREFTGLGVALGSFMGPLGCIGY
jgi:hypothetical protein